MRQRTSDRGVDKGSCTISPRRKPDCARKTTCGSNRIIDRTVGLLAGQARKREVAWELRICAKVPPDARILCWLVEFAGHPTNRFDMGSDGKTPTHRLHGRMFWNLENRCCTCLPSQQEEESDPRFYPGVFVGFLNSSSCHRARVGDQNTCCKWQENS